jgi:hypothetical protein
MKPFLSPDVANVDEEFYFWNGNLLHAVSDIYYDTFCAIYNVQYLDVGLSIDVFSELYQCNTSPQTSSSWVHFSIFTAQTPTRLSFVALLFF